MREKKQKTNSQRLLLLALFCVVPQLVFAQQAEDLVDVHKLDSTIVIDLRYATADNFLHDTLYSANICLLRASVAAQLVKVQQLLRKKGYGLKVWDAYRPLSVQKKMWQKLPDPRYVADPARGSMHNRGVAVDVTLVDLVGNELEMPTAFDDFSPRAGSDYPHVTERAKRNRQVLQEAMTACGFRTITSEWWHFYYPNSGNYSVLDVPLDVFQKR
ncbi:MAG: D-alanyl-D-alanine dipeptidase [candidate division KSB1 bacterium]|nr:D-alanyl-D-alanine dipeptidase [candidate division KSB1 bacterium]MDZ7319650.1 D-alanyl-D-alanine dipeptidase [candidate division KSB1 bacterium]MDZ7341433.1 D-alanyl-D-alanine dipeptidase [candidate division KSB1 bacterium]